MINKNRDSGGGIMGDREIEAFLLRKGFRIIGKDVRGLKGDLPIRIVSQIDGVVVGCDLRISIGDKTTTSNDPRRIISLYKTLSLYTNRSESLRNKDKRLDILNVTLNKKGRLVSISHLENVSRGTF